MNFINFLMLYLYGELYEMVCFVIMVFFLKVTNIKI